MKYKMKALWFLAVCHSFLFEGCTRKCTIECSNTTTFQAIGFTVNELNGTVLNLYTPNDSFNKLISSKIISLYDSSSYGVFSNWNYLDTSHVDSLFNSNPRYTDSSNDVEVIIPSNGKTYRYSKITFSGTHSQSVICYGGNAQPNNCYQYITSYVLNGNAVHFNPPDYRNSLIFQK